MNSSDNSSSDNSNSKNKIKPTKSNKDINNVEEMKIELFSSKSKGLFGKVKTSGIENHKLPHCLRHLSIGKKVPVSGEKSTLCLECEKEFGIEKGPYSL